ncbi:UNVERIFIED_CONTAM: hypothetical protein PYX00_010553 [Menopon gallinae]|uniref:Sugar transporter SWEET1 n=1 Tax=Menopon gallinae TaxID=328185 RepID=A0AAW2HG36_9NEOP
MVLATLQLVVGVCASVVTMAQMFTGVYMCRTIYQKKSTKNIDALPFIAGFVISALILQQARLMGDFAMQFVNLFGLILNCGYLTFYHVYSSEENRKKMMKYLMKAIVFLTLTVGYSLMESREHVETRYGMIVTCVIIFMTAFPLTELPRVLRTKSTEGLPFPMILSGFFVSILWLLYGLLIWSKILIIQNGITTSLCSFQLFLFYIFPDKPVKTE